MQSSPSAHKAAEANALDQLIPQMWSRFDVTQRWVRVVAMLLLLVGIVILGAGGISWFAFETAPPLAQMMMATATFVACLFLIPSVILFRYAIRLRRATKTKAVTHLIQAFRTKERFWRYASALVVLYLSLSILSWILRTFFPEFTEGIS